MAIYTCSVSDDSIKAFSSPTKQLIRLGTELIMNAVDRKMKRAQYPEHMLGRAPNRVLSDAEYGEFCAEFNNRFAKAALNASTNKEFHSTDDISVLANEMVFGNEGVQNYVSNVISAVLTPTFPAVTSNFFDMLVETRNGAIGETFAFDLPSNEVYQWHRGARGSRSFAHDMREPDTLVLNPAPIGTTFDIPWVRFARGEYNLAEEMLAAMLGFGADRLGTFVNVLAPASATLVGTPYHAPSFTTDNFRSVASYVEIAGGNRSQVFCIGTKIALGRILPDGAMNLFALSEDTVRIGRLSMFSGVPLVEIGNAFVPGTYAGFHPTKVFPDNKIFLFATGGEKPIKQAFGGSMATVVRNQEQKSNKVTSYTVEIEADMDVVTARRWGEIEGV